MTLPLIASLSGGKDSTAMALWLREQGFSFRAVFMDTGWEAEEYTLTGTEDPGCMRWGMCE